MKRIFVALCAIAIGCFCTTSNAGERSQTLTSTTVSSDFWSVIAVGSNQSATNTPYVLSWTVGGGSAYNYFNLRNNGLVTLKNFLIDITQTRVGGNGPANEVFFELCTNGVWNSVANTCSGTISQIGKASDLVIVFSNVNLSTGSQLELRARTAVSGRTNFSTQVDAKVSRSDIRAGIVSSS